MKLNAHHVTDFCPAHKLTILFKTISYGDELEILNLFTDFLINEKAKKYLK